jgi:hypothetical protein
VYSAIRKSENIPAKIEKRCAPAGTGLAELEGSVMTIFRVFPISPVSGSGIPVHHNLLLIFLHGWLFLIF